MRAVRAVRAFVVAAALSTVSVTAFAAEPTAADRETTRALLAEGDRLVAEKDYAGALKAYRGAAAVITVPTTVIEVARMQEALGSLVEARDTYLRAVRIAPVAGEPAPFAAAREEAAGLAAALASRIPSVVVSVRGLNAETAPTVAIDGEVVPSAALLLPRKVNPGVHSIAVSAAGHKPVRTEVTLAEGEVRTVEVALDVEPTSAPAQVSEPPPLVVQRDRPPTLMYAGFGVGAAGLAVGTVFGLMSLSRASDAERFCRDDRCTGEARSDKEAAIDLANVSNVGIAVAVVGAGVGIYALVTRSKPRPTSWLVTPLGARGVF